MVISLEEHKKFKQELKKYIEDCALFTRLFRIALRETKLFYRISSKKFIDICDKIEPEFQVKLDSLNDLFPFLKYSFISIPGYNCISFCIKIQGYSNYLDNETIKNLSQNIYTKLKKHFKNDINIFFKDWSKYGQVDVYLKNPSVTKIDCENHEDFSYAFDLIEKEKGYSKDNLEKIKKRFKKTIRKWRFNYLKQINEIVLESIKETNVAYIKEH